MDIRDKLIDELDCARAEMIKLIGELEPQDEVYPGWTVKELLAHVTGWDDLVINTLNLHMTGQAPVISINHGIDYYNATTVSEREALPFEQIVKEYHQTREQLRALLRSIPPEVFDQVIILPWGPKGPVSDFIRIFSHHELEPQEEIRTHLIAPRQT